MELLSVSELRSRFVAVEKNDCTHELKRHGQKTHGSACLTEQKSSTFQSRADLFMAGFNEQVSGSLLLWVDGDGEGCRL